MKIGPIDWATVIDTSSKAIGIPVSDEERTYALRQMGALPTERMRVDWLEAYYHELRELRAQGLTTTIARPLK